MNQDPEKSLGKKAPSLRDHQGWDGKLRVEKKAVVTNADALSDPECSDEDAPPVDRISADEGTTGLSLLCGVKFAEQWASCRFARRS